MKDKHFTSRMLICAGILLTVSAVLTSLCVKVLYGGVLLAGASCMFFAARNFYINEKKDNTEKEKPENEQKTM